MISTVIIDDETPARDNLKQIIKDNIKDVLIVGEADSVETGVAIIQKTNPDLVLLDINLSDGIGFNILEQLQEIKFHVIFVTAYDNYAIRAFEFNALDYVLKPIELNRLIEAIVKVKNLISHKYITKAELSIFLDNFSKKEEDKKIALNESNKTTFIALKDVVRCKADGNYTTFYLSNEKTITTSKTLKMYESYLPDSMFYRVHQSNIINLNYIKEYNKEDGGYIVLTDNTKIDIARRRKEEFLKLLSQKLS